MSNKPKLEIEVTSNTSGYQKGMRAAKKEVKDFESVSSKALSGIGDALGVNTQGVERLTSAISGAGRKLQEMDSTGAKAFGNLLTGAGKLGSAISGLGIAGAVVAFKALNAEAQNFKSLAIGDEIQVRADAYRKTYSQYYHDQNQEVGKAVAEAEAKLGNWWSRTKTQIGSGFALTVANSSDTWLESLFPVASLVANVGKSVKTVRSNMEGANAAASQAADIAARIDDLQDSISDKTREWADTETLIEQYRTDAADKTKSVEERTVALANWQESVNKLYGEQAAIQMEITNLMDEQNRLTESEQRELDAANQQYIKAKGYTTQLEGAQRAINKVRDSIATAAGKELEAEMAAANAATAHNAALRQRNAELDKVLQKLNAINEVDIARDLRFGGGIEALDSSALTGQATTANTATLTIRPVLDQHAVIDLTSALETAINDIAESTGELIGNLLTGGDAFGDFKNAALSSMAEMAISVGKIAIQTGVAASGIQKALHFDDPLIAIAAGAALVALGAAVKAGLSNAATASASYGSSSVASSSYGAGTSASYERVVDVHVTGTLKANGSELVAVLNNESNRRNYTT